MDHNPQSQLKLLVTHGKEQGYLTYSEVNDHLPEDIVDSEQIDDIIQMINDMGIPVVEEAPDADDLILNEINTDTDEDAVEAATQVLSSVESELGRTTDPVRMYMREMGTVELLTREGEIDIAKRIEEGINQVQSSVSEYPEAITYLLEQYDRVQTGQMRLSDIIIGFVDPNIEEVFSPMSMNIGPELLDEEHGQEDNEDDHSIDPELANEKFSELRIQYNNTNNTIKNKKRTHKDSLLEIYHLSEVFKQFRLVPKQFDHLVKNMRHMMERVRAQERIIIKLCVERCTMPKKNFIKIFPVKKINYIWFIKEQNKNEPWSEKLKEVKERL